MSKYIILFTAIALISCRPTRILERTITESTTYRDTLILVEPDTSLMSALLECDSLGNVLLKEITYKEGKYSKMLLNLKSNRLEVIGIATPSIRVLIPERMKVINNPVRVPDQPPWWRTMLERLGMLFLAYVICRFILFTKKAAS